MRNRICLAALLLAVWAASARAESIAAVIVPVSGTAVASATAKGTGIRCDGMPVGSLRVLDDGRAQICLPR